MRLNGKDLLLEAATNLKLPGSILVVVNLVQLLFWVRLKAVKNFSSTYAAESEIYFGSVLIQNTKYSKITIKCR